MKRLKLFLSNFIIYGMGSVIGQIVPFLLLPYITRIMPNTTYFGLNDIFNILVSLASALAMFGMYDAVFRMFFDKEDEKYKREICSSALFFTLGIAILLFLFLVLERRMVAKLLFGSEKYVVLVWMAALNTLLGSTNLLLMAPTRFLNERKIYLFTNALSPVISYGVAVLLLRKGYYITALPLASVISSFTLEIFYLIRNHKWFSIGSVKKKYIGDMLKIAIPLVSNPIIYWIFKSSDRLMIAKMLGNDFVGIYAIGSKMGAVSQIIYSAFAGGWQYFAFSTMNDSDQVQMTSNIFEYLGVISFGATMLLASITDKLFTVLFAGEYAKGAIVAPYLFCAPLLLMLFQTAGNQFIVIKKTWPSGFILVCGAIANLIFNYFFIKLIGIEGAALGTLSGYMVSLAACVLILSRMKLLNLSKKFYVSVLLFAGFMLSWRFLFYNDMLINCLIGTIIIMSYMFMYRGDLFSLFNLLKEKKKL